MKFEERPLRYDVDSEFYLRSERHVGNVVSRGRRDRRPFIKKTRIAVIQDTEARSKCYRSMPSLKLGDTSS